MARRLLPGHHLTGNGDVEPPPPLNCHSVGGWVCVFGLPEDSFYDLSNVGELEHTNGLWNGWWVFKIDYIQEWNTNKC